MILKNLKYINENFCLVSGAIQTVGDVIFGFGCDDDSEIIDMKGLTALPGFVDIHSHGGAGCDFCDGSKESLDTLSRYYAENGITSVCPTTMTFPKEKLIDIFSAIESYKGNESGAYFHGINMEGPFISKEKCGAQDPQYVREADFDEFLTLNSISKIALADVAPETEGALEFALEAKEYCTVSIAHTNASYEEATQALKSGFSHATHFLNAMTPFTSRAPGVVGAVIENNTATAEIICDGFHLSPAALRILFKTIGENRLVVISDSMSSAGCKDGEYFLGGQKVFVKDGKARLEDGTIAGSTTNMFSEFKNLLSFGIPFEAALKACTINPARVIGAEKICGTIEKGKNADIIFIDESYNLKAVMIKGKFLPGDLLKIKG